MPRMTCAVLLSAIFLIATGCGNNEPDWNGKAVSGLLPRLEFKLTGETGETVTAETFRGDYAMVFFGFSHCHDICPVTLRRLARAQDQLPDAMRDQLEILFISVDPQRDTPQRLREYTATFADNMTGLTGSQDQLRALTKRFRATYGYGNKERDGDYQVSHSNAVYVFGPEGKARLLYRGDETADEIAADLERLLSG